ncbi:uncharacterized protein LOC115456397 [Manduca sexta]|uniref:uncharacterized protein LOC115456397 n=1 Tax=Manduca sexta TaxID=7130 RepID=UPI0018904948|nr:uncharacterized protein LOC115456397 [Manduca sexta]
MSISEITATMSTHGATNSVQGLAETAAKIALRNFEWRFVTFVYFNTTWIFGVEHFLNSYTKTVIVGKGRFYPTFTDKTRQFVLFADDVQSMAATLDWLESHLFYNTGKFIVVCQSLNQQECDETQAMQTFWDHKIVNVVFLKEENVAVGYTYFPMYDSSCSKTVAVKVNITEPDNLFIKKLTNLNKCTIIGSTFPQIPFMDLKDGIPAGSDGNLLNVLGEGLNATIKIMTPRFGNGWGKLEANGSWSGSLADVYYDIANFSMTSAALTLARFSYFQMSTAYYSARVVWVAHPAVLKPASLKLLHPFQQTAQIAIGLSFFLVVLCALLTKTNIWSKFSNTIKLTKPRSSIVFYSWMICMGLPSTKLPTKRAFVYISVYWMWYCFLMRTFYQVCLISALQGNFYYEEFNSIDDAVEANYPFGGGGALKDYYIGESVVHDNWVDIETPDILPRMLNISKGMKFVLAMSMETARVIKKEKRLPLHILPVKVAVSPTVIFFKKYSPLEDPVSRMLSRLTESGFSDKFYKKYAGAKPHENMNEASNEPIAIEHYTGCYAVLLFGWITSTVFFLMELYYEKICKKINGLQIMSPHSHKHAL